MGKKTTKAPKGLTIKRDKNNYILSWQCGDKNYSGGQWLQIKFNNKNWFTYVNAKTKKSLIAGNVRSIVYPMTGSHTSISFRVKGKKGGKFKESGWCKPVTRAIGKPQKPTVSAIWDTNEPNKIVFRITGNGYSKDNAAHLYYCAYRYYNGSTWSNWVNTKPPGDSAVWDIPYTYTNPLGKTVRLQAQAVGPAGKSAVVSAAHSFVPPNAPKMKTAIGYYNESTKLTTIDTTWDLNTSNPADSSGVEYCISIPDGSSMEPLEASWNQFEPYKIVYNKKGRVNGNYGAKLTLDGETPLDKCVWIRVTVAHDNWSVPSAPIRVLPAEKSGVIYKLKKPVIREIHPSSDFKVQITVANQSEVPESFVRVFIKMQKDDGMIIPSQLVGIIEPGEESGTFQCPDWTGASKEFEIDTVLAKEYDNSGDTPIIGEILMSSDKVGQNGDVPKAPTNVSAVNAGDGRALISWDWPWKEAQQAELSWSDDKDAWQSTNEPSNYVLPSIRPNQWYISGLATGQTWYIRVRLIKSAGDTVVYGEYSPLIPVSMESAPLTPGLTLSSNTITANGSVRATWAYTATDNTAQRHAGIRELPDGSTEPGEEIFSTDSTEQHITITGKDLIERCGWNLGETHSLVLSLRSASNLESGYSPARPLTLVNKPECTISNIPTTSMTDVDVVTDDETRSQYSLVAMPLVYTASCPESVNVKTLTAIIERTTPFDNAEPDQDEVTFDGYSGETIVSKTIEAGENLEITMDDLIGTFDEGAPYRFFLLIEDEHGQVNTSNVINFEVHWNRKALFPEAEVIVDKQHHGVGIHLIQPEEYVETDTCDIYRQSADKAELIKTGAIIGETYYDPYPALGENGGHIVVYRTAERNNMTEEGTAELYLDEEEGDILDEFATIIDYQNGQIILKYDIDLDSKWTKPFTEVKYLGGSVQGVWNAGISRSMTVNTTSIVEEDADVIAQMRDLAAFPGKCHIRTPEGSSFNADIQISEKRDNKFVSKLAKFTLNVTRVDADNNEMLTQEEWNEYITNLDL